MKNSTTGVSMIQTSEEYSAEEVIEALLFILKYLSPFAFQEIEDPEERFALQNKWIRSTQIRDWYQQREAKKILERGN